MEFDLSPEEAFLVSRIDGRTPVRNLVSTTGLEQKEALNLLNSLVQKGLVSEPDQEVEDEPEDEETAPGSTSVSSSIPPFMIKTVDQARKFYEGAMGEQKKRNHNAARINLLLAIQYDPDMELYRDALKELDRSTQATVDSPVNESGMGLSGREDVLPRGTTIADFEIKRAIGEGGMGIIYLGVHPLIGKRVAIKVIGKELAENPKASSRFIMEARSVNEIGHHNIVDIISIGKLDDGRTYLIMEYLEGLSLRELMDRAGPLSPPKVLPLFQQICSAMEAIHNKGFVHRDLKPPNIFILQRPPHPYVKVLDFGLAKLWLKPARGRKVTEVTEVGSLLGTPAYMSPEQCRGKKVDFRTDIYSMGVVLYELITGQHPFPKAKSSLELISCHSLEVPRPPSELVDISDALERVISRAMDKAPDRRFPSAAGMLEGLLLVIPEATEWKSHLDFHESASDASGPLALPPEYLNVSVDEEDDREERDTDKFNPVDSEGGPSKVSDGVATEGR